MTKGYHHSADCRHCAYMRDGQRGDQNVMRRPEVAALNGANQRGKKLTPEHRAKLSATHKGLTKTAEHRERIAASNRGLKRSAETCERTGAAKRGGKLTAEHRAKIGAAQVGRHPSEATREKRARSMARAIAEGRVTRFASGTAPEQIMAALLEWAGVSFEGQRRFGRYVVDFYLPDSTAVVEVDGVYWHRDKDPAPRDAYLRARGVSEIHHVTDEQLASLGWLS